MPFWKVVALFPLCGLACGGGGEAREPLAPPGTGPAYSVVHPSHEADALAADFRGSCAFARPPGPAADYAKTMRAKETEIGTIRVRSRASFDAAAREDLLGRIASGTVLRAAGPLRSGASSPGFGYAILVRDSAGRVCRGYVSEHVVEAVEPAGR